jgi:glutamyl-Q tRNA(Asp) synthetase
VPDAKTESQVRLQPGATLPSQTGQARFAPSTTGRAHPGTLLAALLCWLDARSRRARIVLRLEDLDPERCKPAFRDAMLADLGWLGLDWDDVVLQSDRADDHAQALDQLAKADRLYPCICSRREVSASGQRAPDGSWRYNGRCRETPLPLGGWRSADVALRVRMPDRAIPLEDESGLSLSGNPARDYGDPVVRRRDGAVAYQLASVVDDARAGVDRVVRGRDLAPSTLVQVALQELLGLPRPAYRHHLLLLEPRGEKFAKFHKAVGADTLQRHYGPEALCAFLARTAGLGWTSDHATPTDLLEIFDWADVGVKDRAIEWTGSVLRPLSSPVQMDPGG